MKRLLVTGASGFIGRRLRQRLEAESHDVMAYDISNGDLGAEVPDFDGLDWVFHLAGLTYVPDSWEKPSEFYRVNVMGTENVLECCRRNQCGITFMSTYVYGAPQYLPIDERHPVLPNSPYNHSKYLAEQLCQFYNRVFDSPVVILRPFNIFGPGQAPHFIVPAILGQLLDDSRQEIQLMDLAPERDYVYVDDVVDALVSSLARPGCEVYNLGTGSSVSVLALAEAVMEAAQRKKPISSKGSVRKNEVTNIVASIQKAHAELGWTPRVDLREGLSRILAEWQP